MLTDAEIERRFAATLAESDALLRAKMKQTWSQYRPFPQIREPLPLDQRSKIAIDFVADLYRYTMS